MTLVLDIGHGTCRAGFASDMRPKLNFSSIMATNPRLIAWGFGARNGMFGPSIYRCGGGNGYRKRRPISLSGLVLEDKSGSVQPDGKDCVVGYLLGQVLKGSKHAIEPSSFYDRPSTLTGDDDYGFLDGISPSTTPSDHPLVITEEVTAFGTAQRGTLCEQLFEKLSTPSVAFPLSPLCSMVGSCGLSTGLVVGVGSSFSFVAPLVDGLMGSEIGILHLGGHDVTDQCCKLLARRGYEMQYRTEIAEVKRMKHSIGFVALNYRETCAKYWDIDDPSDWTRDEAPIEQEWRLPDGSMMTVGNEIFMCSEILFDPSLRRDETSSRGLVALIDQTLTGCGSPKFVQRDVLCCGGGMHMKNMIPRITEDLVRPEINSSGVDKPWQTKEFTLHAEDEHYSSWVGASALARTGSLGRSWISKEEYEEAGKDRVSFVSSRRFVLSIDSRTASCAFSGEGLLLDDEVFRFLLVKLRSHHAGVVRISLGVEFVLLHSLLTNV